MKKILIATDGSASSVEAIDFALELAAEESADVIFVHVAPAVDVLPVAGFGFAGGSPHAPPTIHAFDRAALPDPDPGARRDPGAQAPQRQRADEIVAYADWKMPT